MAIRTIRITGDEILGKKSREVKEINERILEILDDMAETMNSVNGAGLAAVQVGILRRLVVIDVGEGLVELVNPVILEKRGEEVSEEACLSIPGKFGMVKRPQWVKVEALNRNGEKIVIEAEGLYKKALCHEIDHLDGILYSDIALEMYDTKDFESMDEEDED